jgi:hypothetical protein
VSPEVDFGLQGKALSIQPRISSLTDFLRNLASRFSSINSAQTRLFPVYVNDSLPRDSVILITFENHRFT